LTGIDDHSRMCVCARLMAAERTRAVCGASAPRVVAVGAGIVDETFEPAETMPPEDLQVELADGDIGEFPSTNATRSFRCARSPATATRSRRC
jgi:hypothetical protein